MAKGSKAIYRFMVSQVVLVVKNLLANAGDTRDSFNSWVGKIPRSRKWQPTPVCLPGKSHGQSGLASYSPQGLKEVMTQRKKDNKYQIPFDIIHEIRTTDPYIMRRHT